MDAKTMNTYKPFVSNDLVEALLNKVMNEMDEMRNETLQVRVPALLQVVRKCLSQLKEAAGDNIDLWERWTNYDDEESPYLKIDLDWYQKNITASKVQTAIQFSIYLLKDAERPWNVQDSAVFVSSKLIQLCYKLCEWVGIDTVLSTGGDVLVAVHLKALCLYISLFHEETKLVLEEFREEDSLRDLRLYGKELRPFIRAFGFDLKQGNDQTKSKPSNQNKRKTVDALTPEVKKIFDAAVEDGRFMKKTQTGYEWIFEDGRPTKLCFFLQEVYKPQSPPWKQVQTLFARKETLRTSASQMRRSDWYKAWVAGAPLPEWADDIWRFIRFWKPKNK